MAAVLQRIFDFFFLVIWPASMLGIFSFWIVSRKRLNAIEASDIRKILKFFSYLSVVSVQLLFLTFIPLTIDRSFSVWLLSRSANPESQSRSIAEYESDINDFFLKDRAELTRRLEEQVKLGNLKRVEKTQGFKLTKRGEHQVAINLLTARIFGLSNKYTDGVDQ
jgi:hypothetical protein